LALLQQSVLKKYLAELNGADAEIVRMIYKVPGLTHNFVLPTFPLTSEIKAKY
jgi:hypothetical protein